MSIDFRIFICNPDANANTFHISMALAILSCVALRNKNESSVNGCAINAKESKQQIVMIQLDIEKAYDHVSWSFITQLLSHMGFGERMSCIPFLMGLGAVSHNMLNGGVVKAIPLQDHLDNDAH